MAPSGNLFLLLTLPELRRQGLTFLAFYILQRTIDEREFFELWVRRETGLDDYEVSRACSFLAQSGLIRKEKYQADARIRVLTPTDRGVLVRDKILSTAAERLKEGVPRSGRLRGSPKRLNCFNKAIASSSGRCNCRFSIRIWLRKKPRNRSGRSVKLGSLPRVGPHDHNLRRAFWNILPATSCGSAIVFSRGGVAEIFDGRASATIRLPLSHEFAATAVSGVDL